MSLSYIDTIAFLRPNVPPAMEWRKIGSLWASRHDDKAECRIYAWHQGLCIARPPAEGGVHIQGTLVAYVMGERVEAGFITTTQTAASNDVYSIILECAPLVDLDGGQLVLTVEDD